MRKCAANLEGQWIGWATAERRGSCIPVTVDCEYAPEVFYRAELVSGEHRRPLGLLIPEEGRFRLEKSLPERESWLLDESQPLVCEIHAAPMDGSKAPEPPREQIAEPETPEPVQSILEPLGLDFDSLEPFRQDHVRDALLKHALEGREDLLFAPCDWGGYGVFPRQQEERLAPFFTLLTPGRCGEREYWLLALDREGCPILPPETDRNLGAADVN